MVPRETIDQIRQANDIVDIIRTNVFLQQKGSNWVARCPFLDHNDGTASFSVSPAKQIFKCFGCGRSGNVYSFLMEYNRMSFMGAVRFLAMRAGIEIGEDDSDLDLNLTARLQELNEEVMEFINFGSGGSAGTDYLYRRGLDDEIIKDFRLGYWTTAVPFKYSSKEYFSEVINKSGLYVIGSDLSNKPRFSGRHIFPFIDVNGKVIGFAGGNPDKEPKYTNSPDTPLYKKSYFIYGLYQAKDAILKYNTAIVVEGYFDCLSMHRIGLHNTVATCGTAFTSGQAKLLYRYCSEVVMMYDMDEAGKKGIETAVALLYDVGINVRICDYGADDPDQLINIEGGGIDSVRGALAITFTWQEYLFYTTPDVVPNRTQQVAKAKRMSALIENPERRSLFLDEVATVMEVTRRSLEFKQIEYRRNVPVPELIKEFYYEALLLSAIIQDNTRELPDNIFSDQSFKLLYSRIKSGVIDAEFYDGLDADMCKMMGILIEGAKSPIDFESVQSAVLSDHKIRRRNAILSKIRQREIEGKDCSELISKLGV